MTQAADLRVGQLLELQIGAVAHGGHCVARHEGRVVFVRHALPGETAVVRLTEVRTGSFCRGDAVDVLVPHPDRVPVSCSHFRPGGCGGCDFQQASATLQRELKAQVVAEQLDRLAGLTMPVVVEQLPGDGFGWRTRVRWALDDDGAIGPRRFRSHRVVGVSAAQPCAIAVGQLSEQAAVLDVPPAVRRADRASRGRGRQRRPVQPEVVLVARPDDRPIVVWPGDSSAEITEHAAGRDFSVAADGFWQVHPAAADTLSAAVKEAISGRLPLGGTAWDLYGGVGLFAPVLADAVGETGAVITVEQDRTASALAALNLADLPQVQAVTDRVDVAVAGQQGVVDAIVLDPPRTGAGPQLCADLAARGAAVIVYVACDPAALGRDAAALMAAGYRLESLRAFDCFPQTHHVECVAAFVPQ